MILEIPAITVILTEFFIFRFQWWRVRGQEGYFIMLTKFLITSRQSLLLSLFWPSCGLGLRIGLTIASQQRVKVILLAEFNNRHFSLVLRIIQGVQKPVNIVILKPR